MEMETEGCRFFESCTAPLCPMCGNVDEQVFYADEPICRNGNFRHLTWIKRQHGIRKLGLSADIGFFTVGMLEVLGKASRGLRGISSDSDWEDRLALASEWCHTMMERKEHAKTLRQEIYEK